MESRWTPALGRAVLLREGNSDQEVWDATFVHQYHVPPVDIHPKTVLDLGANIGLTAAHYAVLWPDAKIVAVEMDCECAELARLNALTCEVLQYAVSDKDGVGYYDSSVWSSNFALGSGGTPVWKRRLAGILDGKPVDFVKMDVEGAEWDIFRSDDWAPLVNSLLVELHGAASNEILVEDAIEGLAAMGYTATRHPLHPRAVWATR